MMSPTRSRWLASIAGTLLFTVANSGAAQPGGTFGELEFVRDQQVRVVAGPRSVEVRAGARSTTAFQGRDLQMWSGANEHGVLVAAMTRRGIETAFVPIVDRVPGPARRSPITRLAGDDWAPVGAAIAARPDGFAAFWQEANMRAPGELYRTVLARFDLQGRPVGETGEVRARWPMADVAYEPGSNRYYMLLYFGSPRGTRLCGVHVDGETLTSMEHPFWVSVQARSIEDARLVRDGARLFALYLAGENVDRIFEANVTQGQWAQEPPNAPVQRGVLRPGHVYAGLVRGDAVDLLWAPF
jgi:hypothetical protein